MKKNLTKPINLKRNLRQILLGIFLAASMVLPGFMSATYGQDKPIDLQFENVSIKEVLREIEKQVDFTFFYNDAKVDVAQNVSISLRNASLDNVLATLFEDSNIEYKITGSQIVLTAKQVVPRQERRAIEISGSVSDFNTKASLPGVNIVVKGTTQGTISDINGNFNLTARTGDVLVFSFIGYITEEIVVETSTTVNVGMKEETTKLDEIVVIGYGTSSKKLLTSSVASVNAEEIENTVSNGIEAAIQGKTSGVQIVQNSGTPGAAMSVNIRGKSSISAGTQPLYVIDGIPMTTGDYGQIGFEGQGIDASADINPNNIESISVLKDASAAAIYGARAANGVILITTKSGKKGKSKIDYKSYYGFQKIWRKLDMMNAEEWKEYVSEFDPGFAESLDPAINTDWQEEVLRVAPIMNHELSVSGGDEKTNFYISGRYFNQQGIVLGSDYEKYNGRVNVDHNISKKLKVGARIGINYSANNRIVGDQSINGVLPNAISKPPVYAVKDAEGNYLEEGFWDNPVAIGNEVTNEALTLRNISNLFAEYRILPDLKFKNQWGIDIYNLQERRYEPTTVKRGANSNGIAISATSDVMKITQQSTLNYMKAINKHNFDVLLGYSFETISERYNRIRGINFPSDALEYITSAGTIEDASSNAFNEGIESFFTRLDYNYDNKYIFSFSVRRDGSSNFGKNNRYAYLPAGSFAYRIGEEPFMDAIPQISELKVKLSVGLAGNDKIGAFRARNLYSSGYNYNANAGLIPTQIPNPDLKWETTRSINFGFDLGLFKDRVNFSTDMYYNLTTDLLLDRPIPGSSGFSSVSSNVGELENKGIEFLLSTENIQTDNLSWTTSVNFSINRNEVLKLYNDQPITEVGRGHNAVIVGQPIGVFYMYKSLGVDPSTGDLVFVNRDDNPEYTDADRMVVGDPNPDFTGGVTNNFRYKNFDLNVFFQFSYGNDVFNGTRQYAESMKFGTSDNQLRTVKDRWQQPGDVTYVPRNNGLYNLFPLSSHYIEDGSYLRVKEITLGYNFPSVLMNRVNGIQSVRLYAQAQNLFTLTPYSGMDPEVNYSGVSSITSGTDFFTYPQPQSFIMGIKMTF